MPHELLLFFQQHAVEGGVDEGGETRCLSIAVSGQAITQLVLHEVHEWLVAALLDDIVERGSAWAATHAEVKELKTANTFPDQLGGMVEARVLQECALSENIVFMSELQCFNLWLLDCYEDGWFAILVD